MFSLKMLTAIQLNDEFFAWSTKVKNVISNGMLISEVNISHAVRPQMCPKLCFRFGQVALQFFCPPKDFGCSAFMHYDPLCPSGISPISKNGNGGGVKLKGGMKDKYPCKCKQHFPFPHS